MADVIHTPSGDRVLDWIPHHDPRSRGFAVRSIVAAPPRRKKSWHVHQPALDQQAEGACVGFCCVHELLATPVRVDLAAAARLGQQFPRDPDALARAMYRRAKDIDEWPGSEYEGTSVNAGLKVLRELGFVHSWRWAFGVADVSFAINRGPVILGIPWRQGMYEAPGGRLEVRGKVVGGHCILAVGWDPACKAWGDPVEAFLLQNSWGPSFGVDGLAWIRATDLGALLDDRGEAAVVWTRSYGR